MPATTSDAFRGSAESPAVRAGSCLGSFGRCFVYLLQWHLRAIGELPARFKLRRDLYRFTVQPANLHFHFAERGAYADDFALQLSTFGRESAQAKGRCLANDHFAELVSITARAKHR